MARGLYVPCYVGLSRHRKTLRAAAMLKCDRHLLVGHLIEFWSWSATNAQSDGKLPGVTAEEIACAAEWGDNPELFCSALVSAGFLDRLRGGGFSVHDWADYGGRVVTEQEKDRERKRALRGGIPPPPAVEVPGNSAGNPPEFRGKSDVDETRRDDTRRDETEERARATTTEEPEFPPDENGAAPDFDAWFTAYFRPEGREAARTAWGQLTTDEQRKAAAAVAAWCEARKTTELQYRPMPENWLRGKRFNDETPTLPTALCTRCGKEPRLAGCEMGRLCFDELDIATPWTTQDEKEFGPSPHWPEYVNAHKDLPPPWPVFMAWLSADLKKRAAATAATNPMNTTKPLAAQGDSHAQSGT